MINLLRKIKNVIWAFNRTVFGKIISGLIALVTIGVGVVIYILLHPNLPEPVLVYDLVRTNKDWTEAERQWYYHTSQGSQVMPYDWFIALEVPDSSKLFKDNDYITRMRFIPDPNSMSNPDLLPVGFAKDDPDPVTGIQNVGVTCALCHTLQLNYHGIGVRIDGAPGAFNFDTFLQQLIIAVGVTVKPSFISNLFERKPDKFERFARRVLQDQYGEDLASKLKTDVRKWLEEKVVQQLEQFGTNNASKEKPTRASFGRLDALGTGGNNLYRKLTTSNLRVLNSPVTAFPLWYVGYYDWVQSNGSIRQPLARNIIEALAVNASLVLPGNPATGDQYLSSVRLKKMWEMETLVEKLTAPVWPENIFGRVDTAKAEAGKQLYQRYCSKCHSPELEPAPLCGDEIAIRHNKRYFMLRLFSFDEIGTDPVDANNFATRTVDASALGLGTNLGGPTVIQTVIGNVLRRGFTDLDIPQSTQDVWSGYRSDCWRAPTAYPARPLDGIWATPPFLHNNSVPNLYELLLPADQRSKTFNVGSLEFDPKKVGFVTDASKGGFEVDVSKPGNSNAGHDYRNAPPGTKGVIGPELTDEQRWQLVEYMKVINEFPDAMKAVAGAREKEERLPPGSLTCWTPPQKYVCQFPPPAAQ